MARDQDKLEGHREAVREHIEKYEEYEDENDKDYALKTIERVQGEIADILAHHPHWDSSWEDTWMP